jgi:hypothetical protein
MTEEEYEAKLCRLLQREYGEGWMYVRDYLDIWYMATNDRGCGDCWGMSNKYQLYSTNFVKEHGDIMIDLIEKAISLAGSAEEEYRIRLLSCHVYYEYICSSYFWAYEAEDAAKLAELDQMYLDTIELIKELGFDISGIKGVDGGIHKVYPTLEQEAWLVWAGERERILGYPDSETLHPAPEVEDIYAVPEVAA